MSESTAAPRAVRWIRIFCWIVAIGNVLLAILFFYGMVHIDDLMLILVGDTPTEMPEYQLASRTLAQSLGMSCFVGLCFAPLNVWLAYARKSQAVYYFHLVNILSALLSCICIPVAIPLLIAWLKPDVKSYFGVPESNSKAQPPPQ